MEQMYDKLNLTARTYHKILRVARTLADMDESEQIKMSHLNEALCYRNIDKNSGRGWIDQLCILAFLIYRELEYAPETD